MEKIAIPELLFALSAVRKSNANNLNISYDEGADIMYVSFGPPVPADDTDISDDEILYRYKDNQLIGLTIMHFSKR